MSTGKKVSRRTVLGATAALGVAGVTGARAAPRRKPNFVFILADDLGAFDLSCYGRPDYRTPRIDSLARDGMKFNYGYANSSSCAPMRVGLISGRYQNRLEIGSGYGGERFSYMWPLRGQKGDLWEGGTRVPMIVRWPGRIARGKVSDQVAMSMDFLPTFAAMAGARLDPSMPPDGIDLSPQLFGAASKPRTVFWKTPYDMLSSLSFPWKYVSLGERKYLFNIAEDATEHVNLKLKQPERFASMKREAEAWSAQMRPTLPAPPKDILEIWGALDPMPAPTK